jgi:type I restriction-modification system DNA methylase subunit/restriction endonuclease S subunit
MNQFETTITSIRNILRVEGITGLDSINHCVALLVSRYLTIEKCSEFEIPLEFAFENFLKNKDGTKCDDQTAIAKFYTQNGDEDCLFVYLQDKLNFNTFKFKINAPLNFLKIYEKLEDINISNLFDKIDIVGAIYELHLKTGTTGSGMRDLGQYFTNREVIKYMIKLCDPKLKKNGEIESILDPSMGTGGFLSMSIKHLNKKHKNINWKLNKDRIYGFDVDETVKNMSLLNALLECGQIFNETFVKNDTLHNDYLIDKKIIDKVDIILANEPFGLKNIIHANCCKRIKDLKIEGTKAEPLFLQLMMQSLNVGGRCAVIIPDGVLFNDAKLYKLTRKYLCDKLRLAKVISLEDGLFLNTGVKSSILFFVNDGETKEVEFCKIKISSGEIVEELIIKVNIEEIKDNDYSLFVNKYNKVEEEKLDGIEYKKLGDVLKDIPTTKTISSNDRKNGLYRFFSCSKDESTHNTFDYNGSYLIHGSRGSTIDESIFFTQNEKFSICTSVFLSEIINPNLYNLKYIYYYLKNNTEKINKLITTTAIPMISKTTYYNIEIPIPPLSSQEQIVEALDLIYDTIEGNSKLIQNYEKIKKGIIWSSTFNVEKKTFNDILKVKQGDYITKAESNDGKYGVYGGGDATYYIDKYNRENKVIIAKDGVSERCVRYIKDKFFLNHHAWTFELIKENINEYYINNWMLYIQDKIYNLGSGSAQKGINQNNFLQLNIPIPTKEIQEYIVKECEYYDNLIDTLKKENERLQNNKIIETVLKSVSNDNQLEESKEKESDKELTKVVEKDKPKKESKSKLKN